MAQIFGRSSNTYSKASIVGVGLLAALALGTVMGLDRSSYVTDVEVAKVQPIQFSHQHHVSALGIHCAYCHTSVEVSAYAGIPPTHTCMSCHSQIWIDSPMLEPVRESYRSGKSIEWIRVHDLPEFVFFNHSIHVKKGIGCTTCHGPVGNMRQIYKANSLQMAWCLDCHRAPEKYVRPRENIYDPEYRPPANQVELGLKLVKEYDIERRLDCYTCHR